MNKTVKNIILICALCAVALMCVGLFLYDYNPGGVTIAKANQYEVESATTEALGDAQDTQSILTEQTQTTTSKSGSKP